MNKVGMLALLLCAAALAQDALPDHLADDLDAMTNLLETEDDQEPSSSELEDESTQDSEVEDESTDAEDSEVEDESTDEGVTEDEKPSNTEEEDVAEDDSAEESAEVSDEKYNGADFKALFARRQHQESSKVRAAEAKSAASRKVAHSWKQRSRRASAHARQAARHAREARAKASAQTKVCNDQSDLNARERKLVNHIRAAVKRLRAGVKDETADIDLAPIGDILMDGADSEGEMKQLLTDISAGKYNSETGKMEKLLVQLLNKLRDEEARCRAQEKAKNRAASIADANARRKARAAASTARVAAQKQSNARVDATRASDFRKEKASVNSLINKLRAVVDGKGPKCPKQRKCNCVAKRRRSRTSRKTLKNVVCHLTIDNHVHEVYADGKRLSVHGRQHDWRSRKTIRFKSNVKVLAVKGSDLEKGCKTGGFAMKCHSRDARWNQVSTAGYASGWRVYASHRLNTIRGSGWAAKNYKDHGWRRPFLTPKSSFHAAAKVIGTTDICSKSKVWWFRFTMRAGALRSIRRIRRHHAGHRCPRIAKPAKKCTGTPHKVAIRTTGMTWNQANSACRANGMCLCSSQSLCPLGKGTQPFFGASRGDQWTPVGDSGRNQWLQTGSRHWPACYQHNEINGGRYCSPQHPSWGRQQSRHAFHGPLYCCGHVRPRRPVRSTSSRGHSWADANRHCSRKGKKLCRFIDLCRPWPVLGRPTPVMGVQRGDVWVPLGGEGSNQWLQLGRRWPACERHTEIQGGRHGRPGWGNNRSRYAHKGPIYCC